eukprot:COSAG05_NODE_16049_length_354_cov_1.866667_1_plen_93_part_01
MPMPKPPPVPLPAEEIARREAAVRVSAEKEAKRNQAPELVTSRRELAKRCPCLWERLEALGEPVHLNTVVESFHRNELQEMVGEATSKPQYEL